MDFFFCIPLIFGCTTKISPEGDQTPRICPRCHNGAVISAKSRDYFEFCFVPLIPMSKKYIWRCTICQWQSLVQQGWEPQSVSSVPAQHGGYYPPQPPPAWQPNAQNYQPNYQPGYQPGYQANYQTGYSASPGAKQGQS